MDNLDEYIQIVGMEIHVELKTSSKMFCGCKNDPFHAQKPNIYTCPVCLGMPGALPVPNKKAIEWTIMLGLALGCEIPLFSKFDRKNYFYPDLAKGYQISQYDQPFARNGHLKIKTLNPKLNREEEKTIRINRVHLEEDTGKLLHATVDGKKVTLVDFNRSGVPLVEIVTEPDIRNGQEAKTFLKKLHQIIKYLDISDADMEKGSMRLEPNISVKKLQITNSKIQTNTNKQLTNAELPNYKVEVKNINSFNFVKKAIDYERTRHISILQKNLLPIQETRGWNDAKGETYPQRKKETADDYRYFPDPDIPPIRLTESYIKNIKSKIPELPEAKLVRFEKEYDINPRDVALLVDDSALASYFENAVKYSLIKKAAISPKEIANILINKKDLFAGKSPESFIDDCIAKQKNLNLDTNILDQTLDEVIIGNPNVVKEYKNGKQTAIMYLMGQTMKKLAGAGNPQDILKKLKSKLHT